MGRIGTGPPFWQLNHANSADFGAILATRPLFTGTRPPLFTNPGSGLVLAQFLMHYQHFCKKKKKKKSDAVPKSEEGGDEKQLFFFLCGLTHKFCYLGKQIYNQACPTGQPRKKKIVAACVVWTLACPLNNCLPHFYLSSDYFGCPGQADKCFFQTLLVHFL